eukprot:2315164-Rhodomonas_salina.2
MSSTELAYGARLAVLSQGMGADGAGGWGERCAGRGCPGLIAPPDQMPIRIPRTNCVHSSYRLCGLSLISPYGQIKCKSPHSSYRLHSLYGNQTVVVFNFTAEAAMWGCV